MKLDFNWSNDDQVHSYCIVCHSEAMERQKIEGKTRYYCKACDKIYDRWIKIDPGINWWIAEDGEYWHESSGVFVRNAKGEFLFFKRNIFPFSLTVPSGHIDKGENPETAALRELKEEVGITGSLIGIAAESLVGDSCCRGSDAHKWHAFLLKSPRTPFIRVREEGDSPTWITLEDALNKELTPPVRYIIERYNDVLLK